MARSIWKGSIAFGLVQIPVALHAAESTDDLSLALLDRHDLAPVGYERVNKRTGKRVDWKNVVKGYEHKPGKYVVLSDEDLKEANIEATHTIDIERFVELDEIEPLYFERPYYLAPDKQGRKAYALLRDTLAQAERAGVAKIVIRTRQHVAALLPRGDALVLVLLRFQHELRESSDLDLPGSSKQLGISAKERQMAATLVASLEGEWEPDAYRDEFRDDVLALVRERVKRGEVNTVPDARPRKRAQKAASNVVDLMELLEQSVKSGKKPRRITAGAKKRRAHTSARGPRSERALRKSA
jgi:DNA end-binding protein Ku